MLQVLPAAAAKFKTVMAAVAAQAGPLSDDTVLEALSLVAARDFPDLIVSVVAEGDALIALQTVSVVERPLLRYSEVARGKVPKDAGAELHLPLAVTYSDEAEDFLDGGALPSLDSSVPVYLARFLRVRPQPITNTPANRTETLNDRTIASDAGKIVLSEELLQELEPWLFEKPKGFFKRPDKEAISWLKRIAEHLSYGDSRAAVVVGTAPLQVAAYSDEIDNVVVVTLPPATERRLQLTVGDFLLTVNLYGQERAPDCVDGPAAYGRYGTFTPYIAQMLSTDRPRMAARMAAIEDQEWRRVAHCARRWQKLFGAKSRDGRPTHVWKAAQ